MIRYSFFVLAILGTAATAIAAVHPHATDVVPPRENVSVIEKNSPFPVLGPTIVEECSIEDCSDTQS